MPIKNLYEVGLIFRGFVIISHEFKELPVQASEKKDLRAAFISAISTFAEAAFNNNTLEFLETAGILFIFSLKKVKSRESRNDEPIIMYGLVDKKKKNSDKKVRKFIEKSELIFQRFLTEYHKKDFTDLSLFEPFERELKEYFIA